MRSQRLRLGAAVAVLSLVLAACGGGADDDDAAQPSGGEKKQLTPGPGFDGTTIKVGIISPLTGPVASIGKPLTAGNEVYFRYVNEELKGIAGKYKIDFSAQEDSEYNPAKAVEKYQKLKNDVVLFAQILGTPSTQAVLAQLRADKIVAAPASLDGEWVREPNLLPIGGPYQVQMINAATWLMDEGGGKGKTICSAIQDDAYGQAGQEGIDFAAKELDFTVAKTVRHTPSQPDMTAQVTDLKSAGCEVVFLVSTPTDTGSYAKSAVSLKCSPQWIGQSPSWSAALAASPLKDYFAKTFYVVSEGTDWGDTSVKGMADMLQRLQKYKPDQQPDYYFSFGYNQARAVVAVLEEAVEKGDLSRQGILDAMESVGTLEFDGLSGDYKYGSTEDREPSRASTIFKINPTKPIGIEKVKYEYTSAAAKKFEFEKK